MRTTHTKQPLLQKNYDEQNVYTNTSTVHVLLCVCILLSTDSALDGSDRGS